VAPTIRASGVEAAVQRLNDQTAAWMTGIGPMARDAADVAVSSDAAAESGSVESGAATEAAPPDAEAEAPIEAPVEEPIEEPSEQPTDSTGPSEEPTEPVPSDTPSDLPLDEPLDCSDPAVSCLPVEDPEPIEITLDRVTASLEQVWAADGAVWLLPGYAFANADGFDGQRARDPRRVPRPDRSDAHVRAGGGSGARADVRPRRRVTPPSSSAAG
jgi:hypothetical protein